ncbi:helix-turn-helix transcriptional regulator [Aliarcobacter butzleri]|uniref:helix-turn-helix transcriptional regulator n=1 Tax=Aliarcobacter butzleri TaxID=28197 RepID=UPI0021B1AD5C|nr:AlpA family phage regulatory protein [Aliarcobacter butzleri]MCT7600297.1 AlpA family phage regulatory protein [Aliarcobacter butzleri]MCT7632972.1 AlpA family phage regulatory protein [Aliarcobacter butzleri]
MEERLLRRKDVQKIVPIATATIYAKIKALRFPKQYKNGGTACWKNSEIQLYIDIGEEAYHQMLLKQKELENLKVG